MLYFVCCIWRKTKTTFILTTFIVASFPYYHHHHYHFYKNHDNLTAVIFRVLSMISSNWSGYKIHGIYKNFPHRWCFWTLYIEMELYDIFLLGLCPCQKKCPCLEKCPCQEKYLCQEKHPYQNSALGRKENPLMWMQPKCLWWCLSLSAIPYFVPGSLWLWLEEHFVCFENPWRS